MIMLPPMTLSALMTHIVEATHGLADSEGNPFIVSTLEPKALRQAAIGAIMHATGLDIWPGDHIIEFDAPVIRQGVFQQRRR